MHTPSRVRAVAALACGLLVVTAAAPTGQSSPSGTAPSAAWLEPYREPSARLIGAALASDFAWQRLALIGDTFGNRLSGSQSLADAIEWAVQEMKKDGLENVHAEPAKVPHWVRGQESLEIVAPRRHALVMLGLGNSVGTPPDGVEGDLLVVRNFQELEAAGDRVKGKIVLYNVPFTNYGETVMYRGMRALACRHARRRRRAGALGRPSGDAAAAHRRTALHRRRATDSRGGGDHRRRRPPAAHAGPRHRDAPAPQDGGEVPSGRRLVQRCRRDPRPRDCPTKSSSSAAISIPGTSAPDQPMTAAVASSRGKRCG